MPSHPVIQPDRLDSLQAGWVLDPRSAIVAHRGHRGVPPDAELAGHRRSILTNSVANLRAGGPLGETLSSPNWG
jgi:hypothetical protein